MSDEQVGTRARLRLPASASKMPYMAGLDGLRAFSVVAVLLYHGGVTWADGGFLGVEVFFVISGYLITALLLQERERTWKIDLRGFWARRARRLLPALYLLLAGTVVLAALVATDALDGLGVDILGALFYVTNWQLIFQDLSYFETFGRPSPLQHLWSLAVEEQFYLLWPLAMVGGLAWLGRRGLLIAIGVGIVASTAWMWFLYEPFTDPSRVYYGTDTRAAGLLVGAGLAFFWTPWRFRRPWVRERGPLAAITDVVGIGSLIVLVWLLANLSDSSDRLYRGGFLFTALVTAVVIAAVTVPTGLLGRGLGVAPLRWLGLRSYAIYLWHWPIFVFTRPRLDTEIDGLALFVLRFVLTLFAAEVSYRLIEQPIRERRFMVGVRRWWAQLRAGDPDAVRATAAMTARIALVPITIIAMQSSALDAGGDSDESAAEGPGAFVGAVSVATTTVPPGPTTAPPPYADVVVIGDSVALGAASTLVERLPGVRVDAQQGRQWWTVTEDLEVDLAGADEVFVHLGNNGAPNTDMVDDLVDLLGDERTIRLVTIRAPLRWEGEANKAVSDAAVRYRNVEVVDWRGASNDQLAWFEGDGVHLTPTGRIGYADVIEATLARAPTAP